MADIAVKSGKVCIQDSNDFYAWTQSEFCTMSNVKFVFVDTAKCQEKANALSQLKLKPVRGTMKVHAVKGKGNSMIAIRNTSCYCQECINPETSCKTWMDEFTINEDTNTSIMQTQDERNSSNKNTERVNVKENDYVAAKYLDNWYVGKVLDVDGEDNTVKISFFEHKKKAFQWSYRPDIIWVDHDQILCKVTKQTPVGKSKRMLQILPTDMKLGEDMFDHQ
ncbi:hypothetical protein DPMN_065547 [Dreissena polymorpha]|uniref:Uncharacterized protein n=1 Tax=Dreissena polymorpha TaxID=45954 RepID=A0A9D3YVL1_DREPO|nr:hypothetical protein DPMN_065547 [Dreissena polymorpha]